MPNRLHKLTTLAPLAATVLALSGMTATTTFGYAGSAGGPNTFTSLQAQAEEARDTDPLWRTVYQDYTAPVPHRQAVLRLDGRTAKRPAILQRGDTARKEIALTFDDGPHPGYTDQLLDVLHACHVPATFFVVGEMAERYPDLVRDEIAAGNTVGNHTYHHISLIKVNAADDAAEIAACGDVLQQITGKRPYLFRPPGGQSDLFSLDAAEAQGYTTVLWTDDPGDYASPGIDAIVKRTLHCARPGGILLLHDGIGQTIEALPTIVDALRAKGFTFVTVDQMLREQKSSRSLPSPTSHYSTAIL